MGHRAVRAAARATDRTPGPRREPGGCAPVPSSCMPARRLPRPAGAARAPVARGLLEQPVDDQPPVRTPGRRPRRRSAACSRSRSTVGADDRFHPSTIVVHPGKVRDRAQARRRHGRAAQPASIGVAGRRFVPLTHRRRARAGRQLHRAGAGASTSSSARIHAKLRADRARWSCRAVNLLDLHHHPGGDRATASRGFRNGAVVGALSLVGFFGGAILGAQLAEPLGSHLAHGRAQVPVAIVCVLFLAMLGQLLGAWVGHPAQAALRPQRRPARGRRRRRGARRAVGAARVVDDRRPAGVLAVPDARRPRRASRRSCAASTTRCPTACARSTARCARFLDQSGFPPVFGDLPSTTIVNVPAPASLTPAEQRHVRIAAQSTFKIYGQAPACGRGIEGSGFVVVAAPHPDQRARGRRHPAGQRAWSAASSWPRTVVLYDPDRDVARARRPRPHRAARCASRRRRRAPATPRSCWAIPRTARSTCGRRGCGPGRPCPGRTSTATPACSREIYSIRSLVRSGNSGGPLLADERPRARHRVRDRLRLDATPASCSPPHEVARPTRDRGADRGYRRGRHRVRCTPG